MLYFLAATENPSSLGGCNDFDGSFYAEGESWHPTLPGQGPVSCINCTCTVSLKELA